MTDKKALGEESVDLLSESLDSQSILDAVEKLDTIRVYLADGPDYEPAEIRNEMVTLYDLAESVIHEKNPVKAKDLSILADKLEMDVFSMIEVLEDIQNTLTKITANCPQEVLNVMA